jgi:RNA polymerase sigma-70 factor (ECF subfamily)
MMASRNGEERDEQFRDLYQRYYRRVVRYLVYAFHLSEEDAEDLAQEAFTRFYEAMREYRGDAEWGFLETTARNLALNRVRSKTTQKRKAKLVDIDDPDVPEVAAPEGLDYADREDAAIKSQRLHDEILRLPEGQRRCVQLWLQERSYEEIAKALRISIDAVKSRMRDAKKHLRQRIGSDVAIPEE